jgi:ribosomal protein L7Ae-like RNA K-turn-binding protein
LSALKKKQFNRAFHADIVVPEPDALLRQVADTLAERVVSYLALANKAGQTVSGSDMVMDAVRHTNRVGLVIIAADTSPDIAAKIARLAERQQIPHLSLLDRDTIGAVLGKGLRSVVAIKPGGFVAAIREEFERYRNFVDGGAR